MSKHIHVLQHVAFETPAYIGEWAQKNNHTITYTHLYRNEKLPNVDAFDILVVMGGPMSVNDTDKHNWLDYETNFLKDCIESGKAIIGICLGAQLLAKVLGSKIYQGKHIKIGWFPVMFDKRNLHMVFKTILPDYITPFHWHGETFDTPPEAIGFASSPATPNQAFIYRDRVIGLQFHLEATQTSVAAMIEEMGHEITESKYTEPPANILNDKKHYPANNKLMENIMEYMVGRT